MSFWFFIIPKISRINHSKAYLRLFNLILNFPDYVSDKFSLVILSNMTQLGPPYKMKQIYKQKSVPKPLLFFFKETVYKISYCSFRVNRAGLVLGYPSSRTTKIDVFNNRIMYFTRLSNKKRENTRLFKYLPNPLCVPISLLYITKVDP